MAFSFFLFLSKFSLSIKISVKSKKRPTSRKAISFDWFAGILTQSSCCGSSSVPAGHGFWPQNARTLQDENKINQE